MTGQLSLHFKLSLVSSRVFIPELCATLQLLENITSYNKQLNRQKFTSRLAIAWSTRASTKKDVAEISAADRISGFAVKFTTEAVSSRVKFLSP